ncbi:MAG TPA: M15 family metallopeptidase [Longimicrobiales bacterium]|nr:M15 family metallopeptidase [Longimicrobiales bacterium]
MVKRLFLVSLLAGCVGETPDALPSAGLPPPAATAEQRQLVGEYLLDADTLSILEAGGGLRLLDWRDNAMTSFAPGASDPQVLPVYDDEGGVSAVQVDGRDYARLHLGAEDGGTFRITPIRPPDELRAEALAATPPVEAGDFLPSDLVELITLDPSIRLDIRYASTNNFMGEVFYSEARAFLQRPAAEALVRAHRWLKSQGYGLLIHDGYRPWYVTKMFWEATPEPLRVFVADPATGSRHNRGCAVDLTLFDLDTGEPIEMTGGYDEMSPRSFPNYPGGTTRQRWHRELLRAAMEAQDFEVYEAEWWHFDYTDWSRYRIGNQRFEEIGAPPGA